MFTSTSKKRQSTEAMRQAAALLERLRRHQLAFLEHKQAELERAVAESGGGPAEAALDEADFDDFWS